MFSSRKCFNRGNQVLTKWWKSGRREVKKPPLYFVIQETTPVTGIQGQETASAIAPTNDDITAAPQ